MSHIVKKQFREEPKKKAMLARKLGGQYIVVHGIIVFGPSKDEHALPGDIVDLDDEDAGYMLEHGVVEKYEGKRASGREPPPEPPPSVPPPAPTPQPKTRAGRGSRASA